VLEIAAPVLSEMGGDRRLVDGDSRR